MKKKELNKIYMGQTIAMQEGSIIIGPKLAFITKREEYRQCRKCHKVEETLNHVLSGCSGRRKEIIARHDKIIKRNLQIIMKEIWTV